MAKKYNSHQSFLGPIILIIFLLVVLLVVVLNIKTVQLLDTKAAGTIDTLEYLLSDHAIGKSDDPKSNGITQYVSGNSSFLVKNASGSQYEHHKWDDNYIYLVQDTSVGGMTVNGASPNSYRFNQGIWMKRHMKIGEIINVVPTVTWYERCREVGNWPNWGYYVYLEDQKRMNLGGDLGTQDVIILKYDYGSGYERLFYSREWGFVRWEEYDQETKTLKRTADFNRISKLAPLKTSCGTPQPALYTPTPTPRPTQSTSTPTVTPTVITSPTNTPIVTITPTVRPTPRPTPVSGQGCPGNLKLSDKRKWTLRDILCFLQQFDTRSLRRSGDFRTIIIPR